MWNFGLPSGNKPCYPSAALVNGKQHGTAPDLWPNAGTACADPGTPGGMGNAFPTYFSVNFCGADEIRVSLLSRGRSVGWLADSVMCCDTGRSCIHCTSRMMGSALGVQRTDMVCSYLSLAVDAVAHAD